MKIDKDGNLHEEESSVDTDARRTMKGLAVLWVVILLGQIVLAICSLFLLAEGTVLSAIVLGAWPAWRLFWFLFHAGVKQFRSATQR